MIKKGYHVAVVGATGAVGQKIIELLENEMKFNIVEVTLLSSKRSAGKVVQFKGREIIIQEAKTTSFEGVDIAFFSAGGEVSRQFVNHAVTSGAIVIDNTSEYRMAHDVPLVVPEVNAHTLKEHNGIIAVPNCSALQMVTALQPIRKSFGIERIIVSTYQAVSGSGIHAIHELKEQAESMLTGEEVKSTILPAKKDKKHYPIAFNVLPQVDIFTDNDFTFEEVKMIQETKKILEDQNLKMAATCVRVPVVSGHSESVYIELEKEATVAEIREVLLDAPGVVLQDNPSEQLYPMPLYAEGKIDTFVGRIRKDPDTPKGFHLWIVSDNLLKGAAWNSVQIAETLVEEGII
ncbi:MULTISPECIES: aspartate-semialdehyde dehydrogenase [Bacillus cereus group]|uniref:Aspartate-semialdehyde dehydrogenase n=1 Tax=Bacillus wiedmannii TaxID=1890302 RepID=A0ABD6TU77_9BACI|nr:MULTISPECIES: aspartate-semialdehyde dehydrogenase [Bacillus cereus group]KAA0784154.1 aspartate-semialdehyde dehydrogenase [Bacillus sp. BB081]PEO57012.1 aspartate-semialdehyde dehydrogenase [Bacillus wiedmannii]PEP70617.1 aspartate-semialdehyde dehydrogenase [Bacillus wiedmannii]PGB91880.1 aspartate-semialdehyde dehydrogenase [Bacillus wiedmannii]PGC17996.1 aspartate-semialdehyde dehydrogenase [Bacillus wiedmannii]